MFLLWAAALGAAQPCGLSQGILLPRVYRTTASPLWLELRGPAAWQASPSWTVYRLDCHRLLPWLWVTFAMVPDAAWLGSDQQPWGTAPAAGPVGRLGRPRAPDPWGVVCCCPSLGRPRHARVCGVLGHFAPVHRCARLVCFVACAVSWATWLLFTGAPARCALLRVRCPGPLGFCSPLCPLGALSCVCGPLAHLAALHLCVRSVRCVVCAVSWVTWLLFTGVLAPCVVLRVRCPGPLGSCSPVCSLCVLCRICGALGHLAPVHWCARSVRCVACVRCPELLGSCSPVCPLLCCPACAVSSGTWLLFTGVPARCVVLRVRCPPPLGSCSMVRTLRVLCCCAVSWADWLLFTGLPARCAVFRVQCPGPLGSCSLVCSLGVLCCVCGVLGHLAPVHWCARSVRCVAYVRCPGPLGSCSPVCPLGVLCGVCGVLGHLARVHRCARSARCVACAGFWATWLPVHQCACLVCCVACAESWAIWLLFTGAHAWCVVLRARCPGLLGSCSLVCSLGLLCCVRAVLGLLVPLHRCARSVCCAVCCACGVLGLLAPVHRCARWVCCVACVGCRCGARIGAS